jgi:RNA polymerase sigma-70 factor, ECF subfamily
MAADGADDHADRRTRFEAAALPWMRALYGMAFRLTHGSDEASDLVQETYLRAFRGFDSFVPGTNCKAWLFRILYSVFINRSRKAQREPAGMSIEDLEKRYQVWVEAGGGPAAGAPTSFTDGEIEEALRHLPESFRSAVLLVDVEELSYEEAAAALECPIGTLRSRLFRARKLLFAALQGYARQTHRLKTPAGDK